MQHLELELQSISNRSDQKVASAPANEKTTKTMQSTATQPTPTPNGYDTRRMRSAIEKAITTIAKDFDAKMCETSLYRKVVYLNQGIGEVSTSPMPAVNDKFTGLLMSTYLDNTEVYSKRYSILARSVANLMKFGGFD